MVDVPIKRGDIGAVVTVVPGAMNDPQWVQQLDGSEHGALREILLKSRQAEWKAVSHGEWAGFVLSSWLSWSRCVTNVVRGPGGSGR
jgi:hypothetical protein